MHIQLFLCVLALAADMLACSHPSQPLVSVIMRSYNRDIYLDLAIQSVLNQTYEAWELIIIDDGSSNPHTLRTLLHYQQLQPSKLRVILHNANLGYPFGPIHGYAEAQGQLVAIMDDDDLMHPAKLEKQVAAFLSDPGLGWVATWMSHVDKCGQFVRHHHLPAANYEAFKVQMFGFCVVGNQAVMVNRSVIGAEQHFEGHLCEDWYAWTRLLQRSVPFKFVPEALVGYRLHFTG